MRNWFYVAAGCLAVLAFWILGGPSRAQAKAERQRDGMLMVGSGRAKHKAHKAGIQADKHQRNAVKAEEVGQKVMDKVGTNNEPIADLLDSWRKPVDGL